MKNLEKRKVRSRNKVRFARAVQLLYDYN